MHASVGVLISVRILLMCAMVVECSRSEIMIFQEPSFGFKWLSIGPKDKLMEVLMASDTET